MTLHSIATLATFIHLHSQAWQMFRSHHQSADVTAFEFSQEDGCYVATDADGARYYFRVYRDVIVALVFPSITAALIDGDFITLPTIR